MTQTSSTSQRAGRVAVRITPSQHSLANGKLRTARLDSITAGTACMSPVVGHDPCFVSAMLSRYLPFGGARGSLVLTAVPSTLHLLSLEGSWQGQETWMP